MATFKNYSTANIGTTSSTVYTAPTKGIVIGLTASNLCATTAPITITLMKSGSASGIVLVKERRIERGQFVDFMQGNKLVLETGDALLANTNVSNGYNLVVSVLEGVT